MFGWRGRLGLLVPVDNAVIEPEYALTPVEGVSVHVTRLTTIERNQMPTNGIELSLLFRELGVDAIGYACAETSFLDSVDTNRWLTDEVGGATGLPAVTATQAMLQALDALDARRVALASPYPPSSAAALEGFLERHGIDVVGRAHRDLVTPREGVREWAVTNDQPPATAMQMARDADVADAHAVLVSATNLRTQPLVRSLERDLGKPVVTTNAALLWSLLRLIDVSEVPAELGSLATVGLPDTAEER